MVSRVATVAFKGVEAVPVDVQVHMASGFVSFSIVGLGDKAVAESKERVADAGDHEGGRGVTLINDLDSEVMYDAVVVTLCHDYFRDNIKLQKLRSLTKRHAAMIDLRGLYDVEGVGDHFAYWRP